MQLKTKIIRVCAWYFSVMTTLINQGLTAEITAAPLWNHRGKNRVNRKIYWNSQFTSILCMYTHTHVKLYPVKKEWVKQRKEKRKRGRRRNGAKQHCRNEKEVQKLEKKGQQKGLGHQAAKSASQQAVTNCSISFLSDWKKPMLGGIEEWEIRTV